MPRLKFRFIAMMAIVVFCLGHQTSFAVDRIVSNLNNAGAGSLRQAVLDAQDNDVILFTTSGTITLTSRIDITNDITIQGTCPADLIVSGNNSVPVFRLNGADVTINAIRIANGRETDAINFGGINFVGGGGVRVFVNSTLEMNDCEIVDCSALHVGGEQSIGGGIYSLGNVTLRRCLFSGNNHATSTNGFGGGGLALEGAFTATIENCTFSGNSSATGSSSTGGGILVDAFNGNLTADIINCTFYDNTTDGSFGAGIHQSEFNGNSQVNNQNNIFKDNTGNSHHLLAGTANTSGGGNIYDDSPNLSTIGSDATNTDPGFTTTLALNGGLTRTFALPASANAVDFGISAGAPSDDQRKYVRSGTYDSGAFERGASLTYIDLFPLDDATSASVTTNLVMSFGQNTTTGSGSIEIRHSTNASLFESIPVGDVRVTGDNTKEITINPTGVLEAGVAYYVVIPSTNAFRGILGEFFLPITSNTVWNFTVSGIANNAPTISTTNISVVTDEDIATTLSVQISDAETAAASLLVTATSANQALLPDANLVQNGATGATTLFTATPVANQNGSALVTLTVSDGNESRSTQLTLTVNAVNDPPTISTTNIAVATDEDIATTLSVLIGDLETATTSLLVTATSANQTLLPDANLVQNGVTGATTLFTATPAADQNGSALVTLTVSDGNESRSTQLTLTVNAVNDPPTISTTNINVATDEDIATTLSVLIGDLETATTSLVVTATSANQTLLPDANLVQNGVTGATTLFTATPAANQSGIALVTLTVSDGSETRTTQLTLTVNAVNDPPTIASISDAILQFNGLTQATLLIGDKDNSVNGLLLSATSNNQSLLPNSSFTFGSTAANTHVLLTPECDQSGAATVWVTVSDGSLTTSATFAVTVAASTSTLAISGSTNPCPGQSFSYSVDDDPATASIEWSVVNGSILSGQGTTDITVSWEQGTVGTIQVERTYLNACTHASLLTVTTVTLFAGLDFAQTLGTTVTLAVLNNDSFGLEIFEVGQSSNATVRYTNGIVTYAPNAGFVGVEIIQYQAQGAAACPIIGSIVVSVQENYTEALNFEFVEFEKNGSAVKGLRKVCATVISPDGRFLYAAGRNDHSIAIFARNLASGELTYLGRVRNLRNGVKGLKFVSSLVISADGAHLYATGYGDNSLVAFSRNFDGTLTFVESKKNGQTDSGKKINGMKRPRGIDLSLDGANVYVSGFANKGLAVFARNRLTGGTRFLQSHRDGQFGVDGLNGVVGVTHSPDGKNVYAAGSRDDALAVFSRNTLSGALTFVERLKDGRSGVRGLDKAGAVAVSPDAQHVYVAASGDDAVSLFARDQQDGSLSFVEEYADGNAGISGLNAPNAIAVAGDGRQVWVSSAVDNSLLVFVRSLSDGSLQFLTRLQNGVGGMNGLGGVKHAALSSGSDYIYGAGGNDNAVAVIYRNRAPIAAPDAPGVAVANSTLTISPLLNDSDADDHPLAITAKTNGTFGTVSISGGGTQLQYAAGALSGADQFTYTIEDGHGGSSTATVSLTVQQAKHGVQTVQPAGKDDIVIMPNPARTATSVAFSLREAANAKFELIDMRGRRALRVDLGALTAGGHSINLDLTDSSNNDLPPGVYLLRLTTEGPSQAGAVQSAELIVR